MTGGTPPTLLAHGTRDPAGVRTVRALLGRCRGPDNRSMRFNGAMGEIFVHRLRVRYSECDQQNVVFNGHYLFYYDVALTELWRAAIGPYTEMVRDGYDLVVAEARLRYLHGARFDELLDIRIPVAHLGTTSMIVHPEYRVGDRLIANGEIRHVFIDPLTKSKAEIPGRVRAALTPHLLASAAAGLPGAQGVTR